MAALTAADRAYLSQGWRWTEDASSAVLTRHPGARQAEYASAFVSIDGAYAALQIIAAATKGDRKLLIATCDGVLPATFKGRPRTVSVRTSRFGFSIATPRLMIVEQATIDYGQALTTLYLLG